MELLEIEQKSEMSREDAAALLHRVADSLARHNGIDLLQDGVKLQVRVPARVEVEFELEVEDDKTSLELELTW